MTARRAPTAMLVLAAGLALAAGAAATQQPEATAEAPAKRPNILFAIADDWSFGHAGCLGARFVETPHFDRIAAEGAVFTRAFTPNAKCAPSRASILTGRNSWQLGAAANHVPHFPPEYGSVIEVLADRGYTAGFTGKGWGPGIAEDANGEPRAMTGTQWSEARAEPPARGISAIDYASNFGAFLDAAPKDAPWVFWYGALEPHRGYEAGSGRRAGKTHDLIDHVPAYWPDTPAVRDDILDYAVEVEHFDDHLGRMLTELEARGMLDDTIVVVTSDHGMPFPRAKGQAYDAANHVPLAIRWPGKVASPGRPITGLVSLIDIAPTLLSAAGIEEIGPRMQEVTGRDLRGMLAGTEPGREFVLLGKERHDIGRPHDQGYPIRGIRTERYLYLHNYEAARWPGGNPETGYLNCDGGPTKSLILGARRQEGQSLHWALCFGRRAEEELFDVEGGDADCIVNVAGLPHYEAILDGLRTQMESTLRAEGDPRMDGRGGVFEAYPYANAGHRGYYEKHAAGKAPRAGWVLPSDFEKGPVGRRD